MDKVIRFGVSMEKQLLNKFDKFIKSKDYPNRSEAIRDLVRKYIVEEDLRTSSDEMVGSLTIIYDHHKRELSKHLTHLQHKAYANIISSVHIHLDHNNCLEVIIIKGKSSDVKKIADKIISTKGVKHGKLMMTTTGKGLI